MRRPQKRAAAIAVATALLLSLAAAGCGGEDDAVGAAEFNSSQAGFNRHFVITDEAFTDAEALSAADVQALLDSSPWGTRSVLADHVSHGRSAAQAIADAASERQLNPLVVVTRLQLEQGLVSATTASDRALDWAMGCGCPDGKDCIEAFRGFDKQVSCMAERMREYLDDLEANGQTIAGWKIGSSKKSLDGYTVIPRNAATAALYTYTPWVSSAEDHQQIYRKIAGFVGYQAPAPGGCEAVTYASGVTVQLLPAPELEGEYGGQATGCFVDADRLYDPLTLATYDASVKVAANFRMSEFVDASSSRMLMLAPELVAALQAVRTELGKSLSLQLAYWSPEALAEACAPLCDGDSCPSAPSCEPPRELSLGSAALVKSSAATSAVLAAASAVGVPSCWAEGDNVYLAVGPHAAGCPRP